MKRNIQYIILLAGLILLNTACETDNYEAPNASFGGIVIDKTTGRGISTEQPNGFRIRWTELTWGENVQPDYFWAMPDGKFNWTHAFGYDAIWYELKNGSSVAHNGARYEIAPVNGAFVTPEPQEISLRKGERKELTFEVIPYIHIESAYAVNGKDLTVRFTATRPNGSVPAGESPYAISYAGILISNKTQYISYLNTGGYVRDISKKISPFGEAQLGQEIVATLTLEPGTYWFRVAVQTKNADNACNYTPVEKIIIE
jgi:hypothetical protein